MKIINKDLINYYKSYVRGKTSSSRERCPSTKEIVKCFDPKTNEKYRIKVSGHISKCSNCAKEFEMIREIINAGEEMDEKIEELLSSDEAIIEVRERAKDVVSEIKKQRKLSLFPLIRLSPKYLSLVTGIIVFSLALVLILKFSGIIKTSEQRGQAKIEIQLIEPVEGKENKLPLVFKWIPFQDAEYYVIKLYTESGILVYKSDKLFNDTFNLPQDIIIKLQKNKTYFWMVIAFINERKSVKSDLQNFKFIE